MPDRTSSIAERILAATYTGKEAKFFENETTNEGTQYEFTPDGLRSYIEATAGIPTSVQTALGLKLTTSTLRSTLASDVLDATTGISGIIAADIAGTNIVSSAIHYAHLSNYSSHKSGTDWGPALSVALASGKPVLIDGNFTLLSKVSYSGSAMIRGNGPELSSLTWSASATTLGVELLTVGTTAGQYLGIEGVGFFTGKTTGTAIELDYTSMGATVNSIEISGHVRNCVVGGTSRNTYYFDEGIKVSNCKNVFVENNYVIGGGGTSAARAASHGIYFAHTGGASQWNSHSARITQNTVVFCETGCETSDVEGVFVTNNDFQACNYALVCGNVSQQKNQLRVIGNHLDGTHTSIKVTSISWGMIIGNEIYCLNTNDAGLVAERSLVDMYDVSGFKILGNTIRNGNAANTRNAVEVTQVSTLANCFDVNVDDNMMYDINGTELKYGANCVKMRNGDGNQRNINTGIKSSGSMGASNNHRGIIADGGGEIPSGQSPSLHIDNYQAAALSLGRVGSDGTTVVFSRDAVVVGSISTASAGTTTYNTTSDRRLKSKIRDLKNSGAFIDALHPCRFEMGGIEMAGFIADEFQKVSPLSVEGLPNAVFPDDHPDENARGKPSYQRMQASSSEVMANIIAELQSLRNRVAKLESMIQK